MPGDDNEVLSAKDLSRMTERAWAAMRAIGTPVPPEEINITTVPAARRSLDVVMNWLHHHATDGEGSQGAYRSDGLRPIPANFSPDLTPTNATSGSTAKPEPMERETKEHEGQVTLDPESHAIALLFRESNLSLPQIANRVGVSRQTLYDWPKFREAAERAGKLKPRGPKSPGPRRGHKSADGRIEAYDDGNDSLDDE
jgi:hypothetical protein